MFVKAADGMEQARAFRPAEQWRYDWDQLYTRIQWLDVLPTQGLNTQLPPAKLTELLAATGAAIDAAGGSFTMHYTTVAVTAVLAARSD